MISLCVLLISPLLASTPTAAFTPRHRPYHVLHYRIDLRLRDAVFDNKVTVTFKPKVALKELELDSYGLHIKGVSQGAAAVAFSVKEDAALRTGTVTLRPPRPFPAGKEATVEIDYSGKAVGGHEGFFTVRDDDQPQGLPYFFTQFEANYARRFFPCNDEPDDKATTELFAIVDGRYQVISNGKKVLDEAFTEKEEHLRRVHWVQDKPHSTYLVAVAVGQFDTVQVGADVPAAIHVPLGKAGRTFVAVQATQSGLEFQAAFLGVPYPWDKFDQVAVPHFYWGGMENTGVVLALEDRLVLANPHDLLGRPRQVGLINHELAHQWFGDDVTLKWWDDTWLNEGFATYLGSLATEAFFDNDLVKVETAEAVFVEYMREEQGPRSHPLRGAGKPSPDDVFDHTSYIKGAAVLRMLEHWVGREAFKKALHAYLETYAFSNATSDDFFAAVGKSTQKDKELKAFKAAWLLKKGYPVVAVKAEAEAAGDAVTLTATQRPQHPEEKGPFVFKLPVVLHREDQPSYTREVTLLVDKPVVSLKVEVPAPPQWVNWNQGGTALAQIDAASLAEQQWVEGARKDPDPVWRLLCGYALLGPLVDADAPALVRPTDAALDALLEVLRSDPSPYVREALLHRLGRARWKRLPKELGPVVFGLIRVPAKLPEDPVGVMRVRSAALALLGKIDFPEGHHYLLEELLNPTADLNVLAGVAIGAGRIGDSTALATLRAALDLQSPRGNPYALAVLQGLGAAATADAVKEIAERVAHSHGNDQLLRTLVGELENNRAVLSSAELSTWVRDFVLQSADFGDDAKARVLALLDEVTGEPARAALAEIAGKAPAERLRANARWVLERHFPAAPAKPPTK